MKVRFGVLIFTLVVSAAFAGNFPSGSELAARAELPDPLVMFDGKSVASKKDWFDKRRPELKELFQHYEYGYFPPRTKIQANVDYVDKNFYDGKATLKLVTIDFGEAQTPRNSLMLVVPNQRKAKAPVFLGLNFAGNHALVTDTNVPLATGWMNNKYPGVTNNRATQSARGTQN